MKRGVGRVRSFGSFVTEMIPAASLCSSISVIWLILDRCSISALHWDSTIRYIEASDISPCFFIQSLSFYCQFLLRYLGFCTATEAFPSGVAQLVTLRPLCRYCVLLITGEEQDFVAGNKAFLEFASVNRKDVLRFAYVYQRHQQPLCQALLPNQAALSPQVSGGDASARTLASSRPRRAVSKRNSTGLLVLRGKSSTHLYVSVFSFS